MSSLKESNDFFMIIVTKLLNALQATKHWWSFIMEGSMTY